jgi:hypothetical protein
MGLAFEQQRPVAVGSKGSHERVGDQHGDVEVAEAHRIPLAVDERLDVRVIDPQASHHRAAPLSGRDDRPAHGVPAIHEGQRSGRLGSHAEYRRSARAHGREVHAYPAALLHRDRGLAQMFKDAGQAVGHGAHDEAVEQGDIARGSGAGQHSTGRDEVEVADRLLEAGAPLLADVRCLRFSHGCGNPRGSRGEALVAAAFARLEAIFRGPDFLGDGDVEVHGTPPILWSEKLRSTIYRELISIIAGVGRSDSSTIIARRGGPTRIGA